MNDDTKLGLLNIGTAAEYLGISIDTLRRWEKKGRIQPLRSPGGHRYYSKSNLDALFGKRYTRDEETLRRTDEELGKPDTATQPISSPPASYKTTAQENVLPAQEQILNVSPPSVSKVEDRVVPGFPVQSVAPKETSPQVLPVTEPPPQNTAILHPMETQQPIEEKTFPPPETIAVKESPPEEKTSSPLETATAPKAEEPSVASTLIPQKENNVLSEEEIEKRINTIIKKEERKRSSNTVLVILAIILLIADIALLYFWFTSSHIASPLP